MLCVTICIVSSTLCSLSPVLSLQPAAHLSLSLSLAHLASNTSVLVRNQSCCSTDWCIWHVYICAPVHNVHIYVHVNLWVKIIQRLFVEVE